MNRRTLLTTAIALPFAAQAETILRSLHLFVGAAPGGGFDALARAIEQGAKQAGLVQDATVEHVPGAGGTVGLPRFASQRRGRGDALMIGGAVLLGASITSRSPMTLADVTPIARMTGEAGVIVTPAESDIADMAALMAALRDNPGNVPVAGGSAGGFDHVVWGQLVQLAGRAPREAAYVAFPGGGPARAAIIGRQVRTGIAGWGEFAEDIRGGRMRALATTGATRTDPQVPTLREAGIDLATLNWRGVFAPPALGAAPRATLLRFIAALYATPAWRDALGRNLWEDAFLPAPDFDAFLARETAAMRSVLQQLGLA